MVEVNPPGIPTFGVYDLNPLVLESYPSELYSVVVGRSQPDLHSYFDEGGHQTNLPIRGFPATLNIVSRLRNKRRLSTFVTIMDRLDTEMY